jgi:hypothetical protein
MVLSQDGGTIAGLLAAVPARGKPFTISEYNHPFPNRFQSEGVLFLTAYGSFHDTDGLMFFDYGGSVDDWETDRVSDYFGIHRNSAMMALVPSCAFAYRGGLISPARQTLLVNYAPDDYLTLPRRDNSGWMGPSLVNQKLALTYAVRTGTFTGALPFDPASLPPPQPGPYVTDTKEIVWNTSGLLSVAGGRFVGLTGFLDSFPNQPAGALTLAAANGFGTITWVSLTADSLPGAALSFLTVSSKAQNSGMVWDGTTTIHGNWGGPPTQVAPLLLNLKLKLYADSIRIFPLDPSGRETMGFRTYSPASANVFNITIDQSQTPSMWFGLEKFGNGIVGTVPGEENTVPHEFLLEQNYPNPFNTTTKIQFTVVDRQLTTVRVYDVVGREVATLVNEVREPGTYTVQFEGSNFASGVYLYQLTAGGRVATKSMLLVK